MSAVRRHAPKDRSMSTPTGHRAEKGHPVLSRILTVLAGLLVLFALITPDNISRLPAGYSWQMAFLRLPLEGILGVALLLALPARPRRIVATVLGAALGVLTIVKIINMAVVAGLLAVASPVLIALAVRRLAGFADRHRVAATGTALVSSVAWVSLALLGTGFVPGVFVASDTTANLAYSTVLTVPQGVKDRRDFANEAQVDAFRHTPADQMLTGLRRKGVVF